MMHTTLARLKERFRYMADGTLDTWRILDNTGTVRGDCDDFAITLAYNLSGNSLSKLWYNLTTKRIQIWYCTAVSGKDHVVTEYKDMWADNIMPDWRPRERMPHKLINRAAFPLVALKLMVGKLYD